MILRHGALFEGATALPSAPSGLNPGEAVSRDLIFYADPARFDSIRFLVELSYAKMSEPPVPLVFEAGRRGRHRNRAGPGLPGGAVAVPGLDEDRFRHGVLPLATSEPSPSCAPCGARRGRTVPFSRPGRDRAVRGRSAAEPLRTRPSRCRRSCGALPRAPAAGQATSLRRYGLKLTRMLRNCQGSDSSSASGNGEAAVLQRRPVGIARRPPRRDRAADLHAAPVVDLVGLEDARARVLHRPDQPGQHRRRHLQAGGVVVRRQLAAPPRWSGASRTSRRPSRGPSAARRARPCRR